MEAIPNNQVIGTAVFEISGGSLDFLPSAISQFQETYVLHLVAWNFFQGTKTSRSWIKRLWCSGHTGTTKASTSTKLLNFTTKLRKLSFPSSRRPGWHFRWALWRFERFESFEILPRLFFLFLHLLFGGPKLVCCCFFLEGGEPFKDNGHVMSSCDAVCGLSSLKALFPWLEKYLRKPHGCLLFWDIFGKKANTTSEDASSKSAFSTKKDSTGNQSNIGVSSRRKTTCVQLNFGSHCLLPRYGTVLACNYQTPTLREYSLSRVRKRTHEKRCHNLNKVRGMVFWDFWWVRKKR